ncbi:DUF3080 family protein [Methylophaga sp.]|uniref:DUF3080 family protein n=1 Tax=Methylophaga sp. TaxID=2024840 RepID=UPI003F69F05B
MTRLLKSFLLVAMILMLSGCDPFSSPDTMMDEYLSRLARVLDVDKQARPVETVMLIPRARDRRVEIPGLDINMLDFLSLYGCELQLVVGERNSIMGRVMPPLNRLRYELRFIESAQKCLPKIEKQNLKASLQKAIQHKQDTLSKVVWNAIWAGKPMAELLSVSKGFYITQNSVGGQINELIEGLEITRDNVEKITTVSEHVDLSDMGTIQQQWTFGHQAGQLIKSAQLVRTRLEDATHLIQQRLIDNPLCYQGKPNKQAQRVKGLFFRVYIGRIQPYVSDVSRAGKRIFTLLDEIATLQLEPMPDSFKSYYLKMIDRNNEKGLWHQFDNAVKNHTKSWQNLLSQCGMQPQAS